MTEAQPSMVLSLITQNGDESDDTGIREAGAIEAARSLFGHRKEVPLEKIQVELARVQGELDGILEKLGDESHHGFALSEVEISLGISAGGSIGVVTAGLTASLTLHFAKADPKSDLNRT